MNTLIFAVNKESANEIQKFWGGKFPMMTMEEAAEFQQAVSKIERYGNLPDRKEDLITEMADVMISISGLMARYDISDSEVNEQIARKMSMKKEV